MADSSHDPTLDADATADGGESPDARGRSRGESSGRASLAALFSQVEAAQASERDPNADDDEALPTVVSPPMDDAWVNVTDDAPSSDDPDASDTQILVTTVDGHEPLPAPLSPLAAAEAAASSASRSPQQPSRAEPPREQGPEATLSQEPDEAELPPLAPIAIGAPSIAVEERASAPSASQTSSDATGSGPAPSDAPEQPAKPDDAKTPKPVKAKRTPKPLPAPVTTEIDGVRITDTPATQLHHPSDVMSLILSVLGIALVLFLGVYAHATTEGVTEDVQSALRSVVNAIITPLKWFETFAILILPIVALVDLAIRRAGRQIIEALASAFAAFGAGLLAVYVIENYASTSIVAAFTVGSGFDSILAISPFTVAVVAMLTVAGRHGGRPTITWSWNALWIALGLSVVTASVTLLGALFMVLLGRAIGLIARYVFGVRSERAYGAALLQGMRRAGIDPIRVSRVRDVTRTLGTDTTAIHDPANSAAIALERSGDNRVYAVRTKDEARVDVVVFDGDRQLVGYVERVWRTIRLRALENRSATTLRQTTERTALLSYSALAAGVRTPKVLGVGESADSMLIAQEHPTGTWILGDLPDDAVSDKIIDGIWEQLELAHKAGLTHRALSGDTVLVDAQGEVWLTGWDFGDVASPELSRRLDQAQLLVLTALRVGADRAVAAAQKVLTVGDLATIAPAIQPVILAPALRSEARENKKVLEELRSAIVAVVPTAEAEPVKLTRFSWRTVLTVSMLVIAAFLLITTLNLPAIVDAVEQASPWWFVASIGFVLVTYIGAAFALIGFAPIKLPVWKTILVEVAASFVNFVAPAGVGPAALNLRFLSQHKVKMSLAVATVALVQVSGFVVTVALLLVLVVVSGSGDALQEIPSTTIFIIVGIALALIGIAMVVPSARNWILGKTMPTVRQIWPRLVEVLGQPRKLIIGLAGNLLMTVGYLAAFAAALAAFGFTLSPIELALIYLVGNTIGSLSPTPGGLGGVEGALIAGLVAAGIPAAIAASAVLLFRTASYWLRIPLGYVAMGYLQRRKEI